MSIESRTLQYGRVFTDWQVSNLLRQSPDGKSASFRLVHAQAAHVENALRVICLVERSGSFDALSQEEKEEYSRDCQASAQAAAQKFWSIHNLQGQPGIVNELEHTFVNWSDQTGYGCDLLIRSEMLPNLPELIASGTPFSEEIVIRLGRDIASALVLCHANQILHRNISVENIFYCGLTDSFKLGNFPISDPDTGFGDPRQDLYNLGAVLYTLCNNGCFAMDGNGNLPRPCHAGDGLAAILLKACAPVVNARYQTAQELLSDLNSLLTPPVGVPVYPNPESVAPPAKKGKGGKFLIILLLLLALAALAYGAKLYFIDDQPDDDKKTEHREQNKKEDDNDVAAETLPGGDDFSFPTIPSEPIAETVPPELPTEAPLPAPTEAPEPVPVETEPPAEPMPSPANPFAELEVGDTFAFGTYEQDNNTGNGSEAIEWIVLEKEADRILVVSRYGLDCRRYHTSLTTVTWESSEIRQWLNEGFYSYAFTPEEQSRIDTTIVFADMNPRYNTNSGGDMEDKIFLLSIEEVIRYFPTESSQMCFPTDSAIGHNAYANPSTGAGWWLLRTPGSSAEYVASINSDGSIDYDGGKVNSDRGLVRPAMWISVD